MFKKAGKDKWGEPTDARKIADVTWTQVPGEGVEWFTVAHPRVLVKRAPDPSTTSWGFVMESQKIQVKASRPVDAQGRQWVEMTAAQMARSFPAFAKSSSPASSGFVLIDGASLNLPR